MKTGGVALGAVLFGAGLALFGYCPGTSVTALGAGRRDAPRRRPRHARRCGGLRRPLPEGRAGARRRRPRGRRRCRRSSPRPRGGGRASPRRRPPRARSRSRADNHALLGDLVERDRQRVADHSAAKEPERARCGDVIPVDHGEGKPRVRPRRRRRIGDGQRALPKGHGNVDDAKGQIVREIHGAYTGVVRPSSEPARLPPIAFNSLTLRAGRGRASSRRGWGRTVGDRAGEGPARRGSRHDAHRWDARGTISGLAGARRPGLAIFQANAGS
jgi:hypothetical protein